MTKTRKDVNAFQKAMLSNTKIIGSVNNKEDQEKRNITSKTEQVDFSMIPHETLKKYEDLAKELNIKTNEAIALALEHFLDLKVFLNN